MARLVDTRARKIGGKAAGDDGDGQDAQHRFGTEPRERLDARERAQRDGDALLSHRLQLLLGEVRRVARDAVDLVGIRRHGADVPLCVPFDGDKVVVAQAVGERLGDGLVDGSRRAGAHRLLRDGEHHPRDAPIEVDGKPDGERQHEEEDDAAEDDVFARAILHRLMYARGRGVIQKAEPKGTSHRD